MENIQQNQGLKQKDEQFVWHAMKGAHQADSLIAQKAEGAWVTDIDGRRYLDAMSGLWCVNIGYGRKELAEAAYEQLKELPYYPLTQSHAPAIQLAEKLNEWLGGDYVIFFPTADRKQTKLLLKSPASTICKTATTAVINSSLDTEHTTATHWERSQLPARRSENINMSL